MQNRAQIKKLKCAKDILKCTNEKRHNFLDQTVSVLWTDLSPSLAHIPLYFSSGMFSHASFPFLAVW